MMFMRLVGIGTYNHVVLREDNYFEKAHKGKLDAEDGVGNEIWDVRKTGRWWEWKFDGVFGGCRINCKFG